jgi:hypothetical protein
VFQCFDLEEISILQVLSKISSGLGDFQDKTKVYLKRLPGSTFVLIQISGGSISNFRHQDNKHT